MGLQKVSTMLMEADKKGTAVIAFDTMNYESIAWLIDVAEEEQIPVIQMFYPALKNYIPFEVFASTVKQLAAKVEIPIGLHLDHSRSYDEILQAIKVGFTSVMFDGSALPYEENIRITSKVVEAAHAMGVDVEAELGFVGLASKVEDFTNADLFTKPAEAKEFIERTGADYLAIAIGSAHGNYKTVPKLDLERLKEIDNVIDTPLVLHGGTGIPNEQLIKAFKLGINKLNVGTELFQLFYAKTKEIIDIGTSKTDYNYIDLMTHLKTAMKEYYCTKIQIMRV
jgi:fructose-bisphosphate aldolase class II/tagatose 1,6-diphosphate aldolase GatY/KbaY